MNVKKVVKNVLFIALVPSVVVAGYYGYKAIKHYRDKKKGLIDGEESENDEETKISMVSKIDPIGNVTEEETKVIPITRQIESTDDEEIIDKIKEA